MANVEFHVEERVAYITINHPPANALNKTTLEQLDQTLDQVAADENIKVAVITGAGKFFVAGADIKEFLQIDRQKADEVARFGQRVFDKIEQLNKPVIAAINGACLGGGLELALACHIRLAADTAKLGLPELNLGIIPGYGGTQRLPRLIGRERATELILTSRMVDGQEAYRLGIVSRSVPLESLMEEVTALARAIASKSAVAIRVALHAIGTGLTGSLADGLELEAQGFGEVFRSEDMLEGVTAFIEKRPAKFSDR